MKTNARQLRKNSRILSDLEGRTVVITLFHDSGLSFDGFTLYNFKYLYSKPQNLFKITGSDYQNFYINDVDVVERFTEGVKFYCKNYTIEISVLL